MTILSCIDDLYMIRAVHYSGTAEPQLSMSSPGAEVYDDLIYICRAFDDDDDRIQVSHAFVSEEPADLFGQLGSYWPLELAGSLNTTGPLELLTLECEPVEELTPRWTGGPIEFRIFIRRADVEELDPGEPSELHQLFMWPTEPQRTWYDG